jgi:hypothetical protein
VADKLAFVLTPARLYLPLARASGEFAEYMKQSKERQARNEYFTSSESARLESNNPQEWLKGLQSYTYRWVLKNRNADGNGPNLECHDLAAFIERLPFERTELTAAKPADTTYHFRRLGSSSTQILGDGFDPHPFRPEPVGLGASHFEWGYRVAVPKSQPRVCRPISWRMIGWHWDSAAPSRLWLLQSYQEATRGLPALRYSTLWSIANRKQRGAVSGCARSASNAMSAHSTQPRLVRVWRCLPLWTKVIALALGTLTTAIRVVAAVALALLLYDSLLGCPPTMGCAEGSARSTIDPLAWRSVNREPCEK